MIADSGPKSSTSETFPYSEQKVPVCYGLNEFQSFIKQYPNFTVCTYIADKTDDDWSRSTSRVYMNQVVPNFMYVPVHIPKEGQIELQSFLSAMKGMSHVAAVNITQPHKSSPVIRKMFLGDEQSKENVDTLIKDRDGELKPYDLNAPAFVGWYLDEVGSFTNRTVILVGVGGVGEPMAKAIVKQAPAELMLVDPNDKQYLIDQLSGGTVTSGYYASVSELPNTSTLDSVVLINAAGKEGATDNSGIAVLLGRAADRDAIFVDIRPQLDIEVVKMAKERGWKAYTGYGMNARNDYVLLNGIARYAGFVPPPFEDFQKLVAAAS